MKHGIYWLNVTAELVQKVASEPLPGKSRAESYVFLRLIEVPNPFIFLMECLAKTQVCKRISLAFEIVSEEKAYISSIGQDFSLTAVQDIAIATRTSHIFSIQSIDTIKISTRQNPVFSISCIYEAGIV